MVKDRDIQNVVVTGTKEAGTASGIDKNEDTRNRDHDRYNHCHCVERTIYLLDRRMKRNQTQDYAFTP